MTFTRKLQNYGLVTLVTVLIWLYAEGQDVSRDKVPLTVAVPTEVGQDTVVDLADLSTTSLQVQLTVKGNTSRLRDLSTRLGATGRLTLPLTMNDLPEGREGVLQLEPLLLRAPLGEGGPTLRDLGIIVEDVQPREVAVVVSRLVPYDAEVKFQPQGVEIKPDRKIDPPQVSMKLPRSLLERLSASQDAIFVEAVVPRGQLDRLPEGEPHTITARLELPPVLAQDRHVRLNQQTVDVTFTILSKKQTTKLSKPVPVWLMAPSSEMKLYDVTLDEQSRVLRDVTITGPRDLIAKLNDPQRAMRVVARLALDKDALDKAINAGGAGEATIDAIEIHQTTNGRTEVVHVVPLNPEALRPAPDGTPTFLSPTITITTPTVPIGHFTIARRSE